jgi:hypothetical protein
MADSPTRRAQRLENSRIGGIKSQSPEVIAAKLVHYWPDLNETQRTVIRALLKPLVGPVRKKAVDR